MNKKTQERNSVKMFVLINRLIFQAFPDWSKYTRRRYYMWNVEKMQKVEYPPEARQKVHYFTAFGSGHAYD